MSTDEESIPPDSGLSTIGSEQSGPPDDDGNALLQTLLATVGDQHDPMDSIRPESLLEGVSVSGIEPEDAGTSTRSRIDTVQLAAGSPLESAPKPVELALDLDLESAGVDAPDATQASGTFGIPVFAGEGEVPKLAPEYGYELRERIAVGGMGEVWEARQRSLRRYVALKRLRPGKEATKQFESEARFAGVLDHPNIVTIYEYGHDQAGRDFYTMKLIEGRPWSELISEGRRRKTSGAYVLLELRDHLETLVEVAQAIAFAHSRGIVHRDIKPGNVMVGDYGEILVVDWGLAVAVEPREELGGADTWTVDKLPKRALICGTPAYMAPEAAAAVRERIGKGTDVYLLGAVLFHLLYGRPPHKGSTLEEVMAKAKVNAFAFPRVLPGRVKPWDALLRPVITRSLATQPSSRYADAGEFLEALEQAIRNYDSAKVASRAQDKLAQLSESGQNTADGYQPLVSIIAQLDAALESWPRNLVARQTLAQAHLELASLALDNGDLGLAKINLEAFERLPPLPAPTLIPSGPARRVTMHPVDGTLVGAPRPTDSLMAVGSSSAWVGGISGMSASASKSGSAPRTGRSDAGALAATMGAVELARARQVSAAQAAASRSGATGTTSIASVQIQQDSSASMISGDQRLLARAVGLSSRLEQREEGARRRRRSLRIAASLSAVLVLALTTAIVASFLVVRQGRQRAADERDALSRVLLEETRKTVAARLELRYRPVLAALGTVASWAESGKLDSDEPAQLNPLLMPLLAGIDGAGSMLRADTEGYEYMLLSTEVGWRTRSTTPGAGSVLRDWSLEGQQRDGWEEQGYDPHDRLWYLNGAKLRAEARRARLDGSARPVVWTEPYQLYTTKELGISVSTPATSAATQRAYVLAFDVSLDDISSLTMSLPEGVETGQVFVLDEQLRVLGFPRELAALDPDARDELALTPITELEHAPISRKAYEAWTAAQAQGHEGLVRLELGEGETYLVELRQITAPELPHLWIGVVVPESHFLR